MVGLRKRGWANRGFEERGEVERGSGRAPGPGVEKQGGWHRLLAADEKAGTKYDRDRHGNGVEEGMVGDEWMHKERDVESDEVCLARPPLWVVVYFWCLHLPENKRVQGRTNITTPLSPEIKQACHRCVCQRNLKFVSGSSPKLWDCVAPWCPANDACFHRGPRVAERRCADKSTDGCQSPSFRSDPR